MTRRLLNLLTLLSLLLCVAVVALWVASIRTAHIIDWGGDESAARAGVFRGGGFVGWANWPPSNRRGGGLRYRSLSASELPSRFDAVSGFAWTKRFAGFGIGVTRSARVSTGMVTVPLWPVALLSIVPPAAAWHGRRRRLQRLKDSLCPSCGYDLRATPGRCPECGHTPAGATA